MTQSVLIDADGFPTDSWHEASLDGSSPGYQGDRVEVIHTSILAFDFTLQFSYIYLYGYGFDGFENQTHNIK